MLAPIALFVYNRLEHTRRTVSFLAQNPLAKDSDLIVFSDGAKNQAEAPRVAALRAFLKTITGFKSITITQQPTNKGLSASIISGVTDVVNRYGMVIVLEDDLVVAPYFLQYMNEALSTYKDEPRVMQVSGYMFDAQLATTDDAVLLPFVTGWGWATWKRAWDAFDAEASGFKKLQHDRKLVKQFNLNDSYNYFGMLESHRAGKINSWGIRWYLSVFLKQGIAVHPTRSLVVNTGFDGSGTNYTSSPGAQTTVAPLSFAAHHGPFTFPASLEVSGEASKVYNAMKPTQPFTVRQKIIQKLKLLLPL